MTSQTMLGAALDDAVLEQLEAEFLSSTSDSRWLPGPSTVDMPPPVVGWPVDDDPQNARTMVRTRHGCCR
jgi:hypothetical protein